MTACTRGRRADGSREELFAPTASAACIWIVFGSAVVYGSWTMDRLESLGIPPSTAPGLVPGLLGIGIVIFGADPC